MLEVWGMRRTPLLPSFSSPLWPGVVATDRDLYMGKKELNYVLMLNRIDWNGTVFWQLKCLLIQNWFVWNKTVFRFNSAYCLIGWGCRIHCLILSWGARPPPNECPGYDTKQSDGETAVMLELWEIWCTPSLPSLLGPL